MPAIPHILASYTKGGLPAGDSSPVTKDQDCATVHRARRAALPLGKNILRSEHLNFACSVVVWFNN